MQMASDFSQANPSTLTNGTGGSNAFTLLELSIVLALISFIVGGGLVIFIANLQTTQFNTTVARMDAIEQALYNYAIAYNRIPCPSDLTQTQSGVDYGLEAGADASSAIGVGTGVCVGTGMVPQANFSSPTYHAAEGGVPTRALQLPDAYMYDAWGRRFRYAVDASMTLSGAMHGNAGACSSPSPVTINDASGSARSNSSIYALISHGSNGHGAYTSSGGIVNAGSSSSDELTNCHCNSSGAAGAYSATYVQKAPQFDAGHAGISGYYFDDIVNYKESWQMQSPWDTSQSCPTYVYAADSRNNRVQILTRAGSYLRQIGCTTGACTAGVANGQFSDPNYVAIDMYGNLWVADAANARLEEFTNNGVYIRGIGAGYQGVAGTIGSVGGANGQFGGGGDITIDASGNIWNVDTNNNRIQEFNSTGTWLKSIGGPSPYTCETSPSGTVPACAAGSGNGQFNLPYNLTFDQSGNLWVTDFNNNRIEEFDQNGNFLQKITNMNSKTGPSGVVFDSAGNMYVVSANNGMVLKYNPAGIFQTEYGSSGNANGQFLYPQDIVIDPSGNFWVDDEHGNRFQEFNSSFVYQSQIGCATGACGNSSTNGQFYYPRSIKFGK